MVEFNLLLLTTEIGLLLIYKLELCEASSLVSRYRMLMEMNLVQY